MIRHKYWIAFVLLGSLLAGCSASDEAGESDGSPSGVVSKGDLTLSYGVDKLTENRHIYDNDKVDSVTSFYVTITDDNLTSEHPLTWSKLNSIQYPVDNTDDKKVNVLVQEGDESGIISSVGKLGYGEDHANAEISLRGKSSLNSNQKSYKIKLFDDAGVWRNQTSINLLKHEFDFTRVRNRLSFDYFKMIPNMTSYHMQFVHLYVKDLTSGAKAPAFTDYGLYEQIEQPNKRFLRSHGLDPNGQLYKAENFEFYRYPEKLKKADDPAYNKDLFETVISVEGNNDHEKLLQMLDEMNNLSLDFDEVFDRHFDRDNYLTWMASNILMDNIDTITQNFLLYSPQNGNKFYFIPWDYDGGWGFNEFDHTGKPGEARAPWMRGISNYWETTLASRFFKNPDNVKQLEDKVDELRKIITPAQTKSFLDSYRSTVYPYVSKQPDLTYLPGKLSQYDQELDRIAGLSEVNAELFKKQLQLPMPFFMGEVAHQGSTFTFHWDASYDLQGDDLTYHFMVAKEPAFAHPIEERKNEKSSTVLLEGLGKGRYFWKVVAQDSQGNVMPSFDIYEDTEGMKNYGVREFYVD
ncbi:CotH kinase family protein [Paenibacillus sp. MMS18-CY102]|uniref:CotH kinase family protein n=1 Tax=Paenibacillus sp. MMS18-CY102 TaxID=2682849 RepID=UPI0013654856|nr:CotH kinase family protein [Paenibacillus sp. MMS18-CY102]MWC30044.1 spore coat protein CotH [Paenibacillus sp. MMS18-CY102]